MNWVILFLVVVVIVGRSAGDECSFRQEDLSVDCYVRSLQSTRKNAEGHADVVAKANKLRLRCSDFSFTESRLNAEHFGNLPFLQELDISFCKIRNLPDHSFAGLTNLKRLRIQSHNSEWSSVLMEVSQHSLHNLANLAALDLAHNNLWSLPSGILCDLNLLQAANFSLNHLLAVSDLGMATKDGCATSITSLDLSHNFVAKLAADELVQAPKITYLNLSKNRIEAMDEEALRSLPNLEELDLSHNRLTSLPSRVFNSSRRLQRLHLQNNSISLLPPQVFDGLSSLIVLNLSGNAISSHLLSAEDSFAGLSALQVLDLSFNQITKVEKALFSKLPQLRILHLQHNKVHTVAGDTFVHQGHLKILSLSFNGLDHLSERSLGGLTNLESLSLDNNLLKTIDVSNDSLARLTDLALNDNLLTSIPRFVRKAKALRTLDLGDNRIARIKPDDLADLDNLYGLRLAGNLLETVTNSSFAHCQNVHILNLAHNRLKSIETASFVGLHNLRALRLDNNRLEDINGLVSSLSKLQWLNVSSNALQWFDYAFITSSLEWLDISRNQIAKLGNFYNLEHLGVKMLDASFNKLKRLDVASFPARSVMENIDLTGNEIETVDPYTFSQLDHLKEVRLNHNLIERIAEDALAVKQPGMVQFALAGNPLRCDCYAQWLVDDHGSSVGVADLDLVQCSLPDSPTGVMAVKEVARESFVCQYKAHCSKECMCCDFYACDCRMQCPDGCRCFHDSTWHTNVISCSANDLRHIPLLIPLDATQVLLDGNNLRHIDSQSFLGRASVKELYLNSSNILSLGNHTFSGLTSLEILHLEDNNISEIRGFEFKNLIGLRELYLHNNDIVYINEVAFEPLRSLATLTLDGNLLTVFPVWTLLGNANLHSLTLARNTWSCECDFIQPFNFFLEKRSLVIQDYDDIQCVSENAIDEAAIRSGSATCKGTTGLAQRSMRGSSLQPLTKSVNGDVDVVSIIVPITVLLAVIILAVLVIFVFRQDIKAWLYNKSSKIYESRSAASSVTSSRASPSYTTASSKLFDVYISYSRHDADFVDQTLAPTLEHGPNSYKLCKHHHDCPPNASVQDIVSVAAESSSRVLLVLSRNYVQSEWPQVRAALKNSLHDQDRLVLLLLEDLPSADLSSEPDLVRCLSACPTVRWGSQGCIAKLRFFLPEPAFLTFQRNVTMRRQLSQHQYQQQEQPRPQQRHELPHYQHQTRLSAVPLPSPPRMPDVSSYRKGQLYYGSEHTYHSIADTNGHIYHTLETNNLCGLAAIKHPTHANGRRGGMAMSIGPHDDGAVVVSSRDLERVLSPQHSAASASLVSSHHEYSNSTSSGTQLLPSKEEYLV